jgi:hypothetical protein
VTREGLRKHWSEVQAFRDGAEVEYLSCEGLWEGTSDPVFSLRYEYRVKPTKKLVPFDFESWVKLGPVVWVRLNTPSWEGQPELVLGVQEVGIETVSWGQIAWERLRGAYEYSTDLQTWHKCGREVEQ